MKASTPIGIVVCIVGILAGAAIEGTPAGWPPEHPRDPRHLRRHRRREHRHLRHGRHEAHADALQEGDDARVPGSRRGPCAQLVGFAEKARKEGLLALEPAIAEVDDAFTKKGLQLTVDGTDPDLVREVLEVEIESMEARHRIGQKLFKDAGGYAPTIGVLGTVMGLLHVMQLLQTPELLGPAIAGAFMATLYGVGSANVVFLPTAGRLAALTQTEVLNRTLVIEGILGHPGRREPPRGERAPARLPAARGSRGRRRAGRPDPPGRARGTGRLAGRRWPATRSSITRSIPTSVGL